MRERKNVLISEPSAVAQVPYLPYLWAVLKSYFQRHSGAADEYRWLPPIYQKGAAADLLAPYRNEAIDVLGLSCYTWSWQLQCDIARRVKSANPECLVVAGGPHPDYKDSHFFLRHHYIDVIVVNDGEIPFTKILETLLENRDRLGTIRGLYLPHPEIGTPISTGRPEVPTVFDHSPYIDQSGFFEKLVGESGPGTFDAVWETNRGCPYACSFCDWGSNTMSKVRRFDDERVKAEVDWLCWIKARLLFLVDANFGILPRDLEIADWLNAARARHGYPFSMYYSPAKNNPDRSVAIAKSLAKSGAAPNHALSIQHTRPEVLAATERSNISPEKQKEVARALKTERIPIEVQLILGIPGDTYELWKGCLTDLMEWGIHDEYTVFPYTLLPNAPAADKEFLARWQVETSERDIPTLQGVRQKGVADGLLKCKLITKCKTFTPDDWVRMNVFQTFVSALHGRSLTRLIAIYLRLTHGIPYKEFYEGLIDGFLPQRLPALHGPVFQHFANVLQCGHVWG